MYVLGMLCVSFVLTVLWNITEWMGNCSGFRLIIIGGFNSGGASGSAGGVGIVGCRGVMVWLSDMYLASSVRGGGCVGHWGGQSGEQLG